MTDVRPAVVLGGRTNALSVARDLGRRGVPVHAVGDDLAVVRHSRYCTRFHVLPKGDAQPHYRRLLRDIVPRGSMVIPGDDDALELIARGRDEITGWGLHPVHANDAAVLDLLDKERAYEIARAAGVGAPRTITLRTEDDLERALQEIGVPCALKPLHIHEFARSFARKVFLIRDAETLRRAFAKTSELGFEMLLTEIVQGGEDRYWSYYTYLDESGQPLCHFTKRKLRQHPYGFGGATYHVTAWDPEVAETGQRLLAAAGARGIACVEFKRDVRDDGLRLIECNSRVTAANELMRLAGIDLAGIAYASTPGAARAARPRVPRRRAPVVSAPGHAGLPRGPRSGRADDGNVAAQPRPPAGLSDALAERSDAGPGRGHEAARPRPGDRPPQRLGRRRLVQPRRADLEGRSSPPGCPDGDGP